MLEVKVPKNFKSCPKSRHNSFRLKSYDFLNTSESPAFGIPMFELDKNGTGPFLADGLILANIFVSTYQGRTESLNYFRFWLATLNH